MVIITTCSINGFYNCGNFKLSCMYNLAGFRYLIDCHHDLSLLDLDKKDPRRC